MKAEEDAADRSNILYQHEACAYFENDKHSCMAFRWDLERFKDTHGKMNQGCIEKVLFRQQIENVNVFICRQYLYEGLDSNLCFRIQ